MGTDVNPPARAVPASASHLAVLRTAALVGLLTALLLGLAGLAGHRVAYRGRIHPGVVVGDVRLGGLTPTDALAALTAGGLDPSQPVILRAGDRQWRLTPDSAGITLDSGATVAAAYRVGRTSRGAIVHAVAGRLRETRVAPVVRIDRDAARRALETICDGFDIAAVDAALTIDGTSVVAQEPLVGRALNLDGALAVLTDAAARGGWPLADVPLPYSTILPLVTDTAAARATAESLMAGPVWLRHGQERWVLEPVRMAAMITTSASAGGVRLQVVEEPLATWMAPVLQTVSRTASLPRFHFVPETAELRLTVAGEPGVQVDLARTAAALLEAGGVRDRTVELASRSTEPIIRNSATADELGIRELIWEETSRYAGSPKERVHNIGVAASRFDGQLVAPGEVFSFNAGIGEITAEAGYQETLIIMDGTTTDGVGGGVCQVSTTLFRAALRAGFPIVERFAHGYRVAYYEQGADPGLDATVFSPSVDLRFQNDTGAWLLLETAADARQMTVTFRLYGTRPKREVEILPAVVTNVVPAPAATIAVDPELPPGETRVLENSRAGASASVTRVIRENGGERRDTFYSRYAPTGLVTAVSPADVPVTIPGSEALGPGANPTVPIEAGH